MIKQRDKAILNRCTKIARVIYKVSVSIDVSYDFSMHHDNGSWVIKNCRNINEFVDAFNSLIQSVDGYKDILKANKLKLINGTQPRVQSK